MHTHPIGNRIVNAQQGEATRGATRGGGRFDCKFRPEADLPKLAKGLSAATRERGLTAGRGERITNGIVMPQAVRPARPRQD
jgi:hypothetical protein